MSFFLEFWNPRFRTFFSEIVGRCPVKNMFFFTYLYIFRHKRYFLVLTNIFVRTFVYRISLVERIRETNSWTNPYFGRTINSCLQSNRFYISSESLHLSLDLSLKAGVYTLKSSALQKIKMYLGKEGICI